MKKLVLSTMAAALTLGTVVTPTFAEYNEKEANLLVLNDEQGQIFTYEYGGIEFTGDVELTEDQLTNMYNNVVNTTKEVESPGAFSITPMAMDPGSSTVTVVPPIYKTFTNTGVQAAAEIITIYTIARVPKKAKETALGAWLIGKLTGWTDLIRPTYVGSWVSSSYDNYLNKRVYHETLVHYQNSNYTSPISVQYWDVTHWWE